jgi:Icc-related predicted phosphoesterase
MRILVLSDCENGLPELPDGRPDVVVSCGDVPVDVLERVAGRFGVPVLGVLGNHDQKLVPGVLRDLHLQVGEEQGISFGGFEGGWRYKPKGHHLYDDAEVTALLTGFPRVDVFVAHAPPEGIYGMDDGIHDGFTAFREYIEEEEPALFLHGHVHLNLETQLGGTLVVATRGSRMLEYERPTGNA